MKHVRIGKMLVLGGFLLAMAAASSAAPTWMGVYGPFKHMDDSGQTRTFSVFLNDDYPGLKAEVGIRINDDEWTTYPMWHGGHYNGNSRWYVSYPTPFPDHAVVQYYFHAWDDWGFEMWDSNGGDNYFFLTTPIGPLAWTGNTRDNSGEGYYPRSYLEIQTETWPAGAAINSYIVYTHEGADGWKVQPMYVNGQAYNNDIWNGGFIGYTLGGWIEYAIVSFDAFGHAFWDNNDGANHRAHAHEGTR